MTSYSLPKHQDFDQTIDGKAVQFHVLDHGNNFQVALCNHGARIVSILTPDRTGGMTDVVLGFKNMQGYAEAEERFHGIIAGRFANRIAGGKFTIDEQTFQIEPNNGTNALHGGKGGYHTKVWDVVEASPKRVVYQYLSPDGDEGFPGELTVLVTYELTDNQGLRIQYKATTSAPTVLNLTNHAYFNLEGEGNGTVLDHVLQIEADGFVPVNEALIPLGHIEAVEGTPFDFRKPTAIGQRINDVDTQLERGNGYDHSYHLRAAVQDGKTPCATIYAPNSGIRMEVLTTEPAMQLYTGNFLSGKDKGKSGQSYTKNTGFCLETQHHPDSPNQKGVDFPSTILRPGEVFESETTFLFSVTA
jgi:aldose 1-epimerase